MRIAISGTHCCGKSTLVEDFLVVHPDYVHEPEPYEWLDEMHDDLGADDFYRQLECSVERLREYASGSRMIAERCPLDFLAYLLALDEPDRAEQAAELAAEGMKHVDLLVVLPLNDADGIVAPESENLELREAMNHHLLELVTTLDERIRVLELCGTPQSRLAALESALE